MGMVGKAIEDRGVDLDRAYVDWWDEDVDQYAGYVVNADQGVFFFEVEYQVGSLRSPEGQEYRGITSVTVTSWEDVTSDLAQWQAGNRIDAAFRLLAKGTFTAEQIE